MSASATHAASLNKLRLKIVALVGTVTTIIIVLAFSAVVWVQHNANVNDVFESLNETLANAATAIEHSQQNTSDTKPPDTPDDNAVPPSANDELNSANSQPSNTSASAGDSAGAATKTYDTTDPKGPSIGRWRDANESITPAAVFMVQSDNSYSYLAIYSTATLNADDVSQILEAAMSSTATQGYLATESLYFAKQQTLDGTLIAFADGAAADAWQNLAATLALVGVGLILIVTIGSAFFAKWALRPVQLAWDRQQRFIADASHELKTPLSVILANTAIVLENPNSTVTEQSRWVESTQSQAVRMQTLVKEMLELAQADATSVKGGEGIKNGLARKFKKHASSNNSANAPEASKVDFSDIVEGCALSFEPIMYEANVTLFTDIESGIYVAGNLERLSRATYILLDNAAKYTTPGGIVDVKLSKRGHECTLSVSNTSEPLTDEQISRVFERFYQTDEARANTQSFGLGLAIAYEIATATGGAIQAKSVPELPGNTFSIILPCE